MRWPLSTATMPSPGVGVSVAMLAVAIVLGLSRLNSLNATAERMADKDWNEDVIASEATNLMQDIGRSIFLLLHNESAAVAHAIHKAARMQTTVGTSRVSGRASNVRSIAHSTSDASLPTA